LITGYVFLVSEIGNWAGWFRGGGEDSEMIRFLLFFLGPVEALIWVCIASVVLGWTVNRLFRGAATWKATFAVWMYASLPLAVMLLLGAAVVRWFSSWNADSVHFLLTTLLAPSGAGHFMLYAAFVVANLCFVVLLSLGVAGTADVSPKAGFAAVLGWDVILLALIIAGSLASHGGSPSS
jgi:hypothetical protein